MAEDDTDWKAAAKAVPELRFLKTLVTGLTLVMGFGMVAVVALLKELGVKAELSIGVRPGLGPFGTI